MDKINPIIAAAMAKRTASGLALAFRVPGRADIFICFAKNKAQKVLWLDQAAQRGWIQVNNR